MRKIIFGLLLLAFTACSKEDSGKFLWEKIGSTGVAYDVGVTSDSLFAIAGESSSAPLFIKTSTKGSKQMEYSPDITGKFTSFIEDTSGFYIAGSDGESLILTRLGHDGEENWTLAVVTTGKYGQATLRNYSEDTFIAIASDLVDSVRYSSFAIVYFDRQGNILQQWEPNPGFKIAVNDFAVSTSGNIYLAVTKLEFTGKTKASAAWINSEGSFIWEEELYNNRNFGAASLGINIDTDGILYVCGRTELSSGEDLLMNSYVASLTQSGTVLWKEYLENSNEGVDFEFDQYSNLVMLNRNCFLLNFLSLPDAGSSDMVRVYDACDSYDTEAKAKSLAITYDGHYLFAGSKSGKFYYALLSGNIYAAAD